MDMIQTSFGKQKAWSILAGLEPDSVCQNTKATYHEASQCYVLISFGHEIFISPKKQKLFGNSPEAGLLLNKLQIYLELSILWYMISAKNIALSGELINPASLKGGDIFERGTHILPLHEIARKYGSNRSKFFETGKKYNAEPLNYQDASLKLYPLPRVPVVIILWETCDEFPARASLLFDSSCEHQLPVDIIWSTAMMCVLMMVSLD
ncbi:MAG: DUF3786 domain-containing protein [Candidatus Loosdrechtia sp.]|uniref:DUF3786 domain-containing protein n=1 Tax=Candidatus Loosdrechtia sp. TaxID=3101272 RepID=UPI003A79D812|nr:MAG: DUF3786 domain-containing protein [Candidatus Jettenia sp. AMX2]